MTVNRRFILAVRAVPGGRRTELMGWYGEDAVKIRVAAAPEDGAANRALMRWLQQATGAERVDLVSGASARSKLVALHFAVAAPTLADIYAQLQAWPSK